MKVGGKNWYESTRPHIRSVSVGQGYQIFFLFLNQNPGWWWLCFWWEFSKEISEKVKCTSQIMHMCFVWQKFVMPFN